MPAAETAEMVVLGVVAGAHGIAGELRVFAFNEDSDNLRDAKTVRLRPEGEGEGRVLKVQRSRRHKKFFLLKLEGIEDRNAAEAARGLEVVLRRDELAPTDADEFYLHDLVGVEVCTEDGARLGTVREIWQSGDSDILCVRDDAGRDEHLVACAEDAIVSIDLEARRAVVRAAVVVTNRA